MSSIIFLHHPCPKRVLAVVPFQAEISRWACIVQHISRLFILSSVCVTTGVGTFMLHLPNYPTWLNHFNTDIRFIGVFLLEYFQVRNIGGVLPLLDSAADSVWCWLWTVYARWDLCLGKKRTRYLPFCSKPFHLSFYTILDIVSPALCYFIIPSQIEMLRVEYIRLWQHMASYRPSPALFPVHIA